MCICCASTTEGWMWSETICFIPERLIADCSVCSKNYVSSLRFTCGECFDRTTVIVTATLLLGLALGVVIAIISYLVSAEVADARRGIIDYMMQRIPLQSLKIIIILWQILTQVRTANERRSLGAVTKTRSMSLIRVSILILGFWGVWARIEPFD